MTINHPSLDVDPGELDRVEELVRYLADHDGRMPTDDMPLAWWLIEALEQPIHSPVRRLLQGVPVTDIRRPLAPGRAETWAKFVQRLDQLDRMHQRGETLEDYAAKDLETWAQSAVVRYLSGKMKSTEELLLRKRSAWSFEQRLTAKRRSEAAFVVGLRAIKEFHKEHGHTTVPDEVVVDGVNLRLWWQAVRNRYAQEVLKPHDRQRLEKLGLDLATDAQIAKAEKQRAAEKEKEEERERRRQARAEQRGTDDTGPILEAIRAFAGKHGHTAIPVGAVTESGVEFGRFVDRWRRVQPDRQLRRDLEDIEHWTWMRTPASPRLERPAPVAIPDDTTQMNRTGLRQFLPAD